MKVHAHPRRDRGHAEAKITTVMLGQTDYPRRSPFLADHRRGSIRGARRLLPFQLGIRDGGVARIVLLKQLPA